MVSCIIPSRSAQWLKKTVQDLLDKAEGEVEVIVVYDGRWAEPEERPTEDERVIQVHHGEVHSNYGMRASINLGARLARGDYLLIIDEQCAVSKGYDVRLSETCQDDWVVVPRRYRLNAEKWALTVDVDNDKRPPVDYMFISYPYERPYDKTCGLHGDKWDAKYYERKNVEVDDLMTMQGSCYFMKKTTWDKYFPDGLDDVNYGTFTQEAQEVSMTVWLSGGRVVVDKGCWYAHWHKGKNGKGYGFSNEQYRRHQEGMERGRLYCINHWLNTKDYKYDFEWLINKFSPIPTWSDDWKEKIKEDAKKDYSTLNYKNDDWLKGLRNG